ncbi:unnamed protein product [Cunninghamella blakesleeana]
MKLFTSTLAVVALATLSNAFTLCGNAATDIMTVSSVSYTPNPPVSGQDLTVDVSGTLKSSVSGGTIKVTVAAGILTVWSASYDICTEAAANGQTCPLAAGAYDFHKTVTVPSIIPPGTYTLKAVATTTSGQEITCVTQPFTI